MIFLIPFPPSTHTQHKFRGVGDNIMAVTDVKTNVGELEEEVRVWFSGWVRNYLTVVV